MNCELFVNATASRQLAELLSLSSEQDDHSYSGAVLEAITALERHLNDDTSRHVLRIRSIRGEVFSYMPQTLNGDVSPLNRCADIIRSTHSWLNTLDELAPETVAHDANEPQVIGMIDYIADQLGERNHIDMDMLRTCAYTFDHITIKSRVGQRADEFTWGVDVLPAHIAQRCDDLVNEIDRRSTMSSTGMRSFRPSNLAQGLEQLDENATATAEELKQSEEMVLQRWCIHNGVVYVLGFMLINTCSPVFFIL